MTKAERFGVEEAVKHLARQAHTFPYCNGPEHYKDMATCGKCQVIVGLRNLLAGKGYYYDETPG